MDIRCKCNKKLGEVNENRLMVFFKKLGIEVPFHGEAKFTCPACGAVKVWK